MYCTGDTRKIIRNAEANSITDNVYKSATAGDYGKCAIDAFTQAQNCLAGGRIKRPMQIINNVLLAMLLGVTVNFIVLKVSRFNKKKTDIRLLEKTEQNHLLASRLIKNC